MKKTIKIKLPSKTVKIERKFETKPLKKWERRRLA
jgi:hypothetical protein